MKRAGCDFVFVILVKAILVLGYRNETVDDQLQNFAKSVRSPQLLTTTIGIPVLVKDTITINRPRLILNSFFMESITQLNRERIPDRVAHGHGTGAFGYFHVTHDLSDICKAKVFDTVGKVTPLVARLSQAVQRIGGSELTREARGMALKFYTEEGNLDLLNLNVEMFQIKDPIFFTTFIHSFNRNARTNIQNLNAIWDFLTLRPETLSMYMRVFGDRGIPDGYRHMPGWTIHTFELINKHGDRTFARFQFQPDAGIKNLTTQQAQRIQAEDLDYFTRDLYEAIQNKEYPSWTLYIQTIAEHDLHKVDFDIFDVTKYWPLEEFPRRPVGKVVLNRNPNNHFADIEQLAFNPGNLVPGIRGVDTLFEARVLSYFDAHPYRLGKNFYKIDVNCPLSGLNTYYKDGVPPVRDNEDGRPTHYPNSFKGPMPSEVKEPERVTAFTDPAPNNFHQAGDIYEYEMDEGARCRLVENIVATLSLTEHFLQDRAVKLYSLVHEDLAHRINNGLKKGSTQRSTCPSL